MKKFVIRYLLLTYLIGNISFAQNKINGYRYWFDNDFSSEISSAITPTLNFELNTSIATNSLNSGIHIFNIQFWDDSAYSVIESQFFYKKPNSFGSTEEIIAYEYWFDNDYSNVVYQSVTSTQQLNLIDSIDVNSFSAGIHVFNIRFKDNNDEWSSTSSQFFYKKPSTLIATKEITAYEYWIDNDYSNVVYQSVTSTQQLNLIDSIDVNSFSAGIHVFNIRFKDNNDEWSSTSSQFFYKKPNTLSATKEIIAYEYWFDNDYSNVTNQSVTANQQLNLIDSIDVNTLNSGVHIFNIRFNDNNSEWSSISSQFFFKKPNTLSVVNKLIEYRYWFDNDFTLAVSNQFSPSSEFVNLTNDIDMTQINKGEHTIHFQFKDSLNKWSLVTTDTITKLALPIAKFSYSAINYCDSSVYSFTDLSIDGDVYHWDFGDGDTSFLSQPTHTYLASGNYTITLTVTDTTSGLDSTISQQITINSTESFATISLVKCDSYTSPSGNYTWLISGTYYDTIPNAISCDSIITINLIINNSTSAIITETACDSYTSPSGNYTWTTSGTYYDTIPNLIGCDSTLTINLTVNKIDSTVTQNGVTLTAIASGLNYQWIDCGNGNMDIVGANNQIYTPINNGIYAVIINDNMCYDTSACFTINSIGIEEFEATNIKVYPNPNNGEFSIEFNHLLKDTYNISILNALGKKVKQLKSSYPITQINLGTLENSVYLIQIKTPEKILLVRVIKQ